MQTLNPYQQPSLNVSWNESAFGDLFEMPFTNSSALGDELDSFMDVSEVFPTESDVMPMKEEDGPTSPYNAHNLAAPFASLNLSAGGVLPTELPYGVHQYSQPNKAVASRKRRKTESFSDVHVSSSSSSHNQDFSLKTSEAELVQLDSKTFENFINELRSKRHLTRDEEDLTKKIFKKIKNRESARKSRQAKKEHTVGLGEQVEELANQVQALKIEASTLQAMNFQMKNEIQFHEKLILSNPFLAQLYAEKLKLHSNMFMTETKLNNLPMNQSSSQHSMFISVGSN